MKATLGSEPSPEEVFHYLLAIFHSQHYRDRYGELLKQDFPRVPLTGKKALFARLAELGAEIAAFHLMESSKLDHAKTTPIGLVGAEVEKVDYDEATKTIWVDKRKTKGLRGVEAAAWGFFVGGYQVCEKWFKDRKGERLSKEAVAHYQRVVVALGELQKAMTEVDRAIDKNGGWPGAFAASAKGGGK